MPNIKIILIKSLIICLCIWCPKLTRQSVLPTFEELDINDDFSIDNIDIGGEDVPESPPATLTNELSLSTIKAVALIRGIRAYGVVRLIQTGSGPTEVSGFIAGLNPFSKHGFHVHEYRVSGDCESAGEHYNPTKQTHGSPDSYVSHVGDLGNLQADGHGVARFQVSNSKMSLRGKFSVIERSLVVHTNPDDLGMGYNRESLKSGNSGGRIGCGTIKFVSIV